MSKFMILLYNSNKNVVYKFDVYREENQYTIGHKQTMLYKNSIGRAALYYFCVNGTVNNISATSLFGQLC